MRHVKEPARIAAVPTAALGEIEHDARRPPPAARRCRPPLPPAAAAAECRMPNAECRMPLPPAACRCRLPLPNAPAAAACRCRMPLPLPPAAAARRCHAGALVLHARVERTDAAGGPPCSTRPPRSRFRRPGDPATCCELPRSRRAHDAHHVDRAAGAGASASQANRQRSVPSTIRAASARRRIASSGAPVSSAPSRARLGP